MPLRNAPNSLSKIPSTNHCPQLLYQMQQEDNRSSPSLIPLTLSTPRPKVHRKPRRKIIKSDSSDTERQLYFPDLFEYKKLDLAPQGKRIIKGSWSLQQNRIYLQFLQKYYKDFSSEQARRKTVVFNRLSKHLQKRTPDQCRSHHQKLQKRFANKIDAILHFVQEKIRKKEQKMMKRGDGGMEKEMSLPKTSDVTEEEEGLVLDFEELEVW